MEIRHLLVDDLKISKLNMRKSVDREDFERLKRCILEVYKLYKRIVEPLAVRGNEVIWGSLRYKALREHIDEGNIPKDIRVPCIDEKDLDDKAVKLFSLIENISTIPVQHSEKVAAVKPMIKEWGDISKVARILGVYPQTVGRWIALEEEAPLLARLGEKEQVGERKLTFVQKMVSEKPELKGKQETLVKAAGEIPRARLESMAAESGAGFAIKPVQEAKLAKTRRLQTLFIRDDYWKYLGMYSGDLNKTISELFDDMLKAYKPFIDFLKTKKISLED